MHHLNIKLRMIACIFLGGILGVFLTIMVAWQSWLEFQGANLDPRDRENLLASAAIHIIRESGHLIEPLFIDNYDEDLLGLDLAHHVAGDTKYSSTDNIVNIVKARLKTNKVLTRPKEENEPCEMPAGCEKKDDSISIEVMYMPFSRMAIVRYGTLAGYGQIVLVKYKEVWNVVEEYGINI